MKKNIVFLCIVLMSQLQYAQNAYYDITISGFINNFDLCQIGEGLKEVLVFYDTGDDNYDYLHNGNGALINNDSWSYNFQTNKKVFRTEVRTQYGYHTLGCLVASDRGQRLVDYKTCFNETYRSEDGDYVYGFQTGAVGEYTIDIKPVIHLPTPPVNTIGSEDFLEIAPITGGIDNSLFNWEYSLNKGSYRRFPSQYQHKNSLRIRGKDIPGVSDAFHGGSIEIRVNTGCSNSPNDVEPYTYHVSAPRITSVQTTRPRCYDTIDAKATLQFSRSLKPGEKLSIRTLDLDIPENGTFKTINDYNDIQLSRDRTYTITGLRSGNIRFVVSGFYGEASTFADNELYYKDKRIENRTPVRFATTPRLSTTDVFCHGGDNGTISFSASGGVGNYQYLIKTDDQSWAEVANNWTSFSSGNSHTERGRIKGTYQIKIRDGHQCVAKYQGGSNEGDQIIQTAVIKEPSEAVQIEFDTDASTDPTAFGFTNGQIKARVFGGTPDNGAYSYWWRDESGTLLTTVVEQVVSGQGYFLTLTDIPKGKYFLTVQDKNYRPMIYNTTCTVIDAVYELDEPDPLEVGIEESESILCNNQNEFADESSNGELIAHGIGGVPLALFENGGLPYYYIWKKQNPDTGVWEVLPVTDSIASGLDTGMYAVNIRDANDIILGDYENNLLVQERDSTYFLSQPELLTISFTKENVVCDSGNNGWAEAHVQGGTPPYEYSWSTGAITPRIEELYAGKYTVFVDDANGCRASETVILEQPNGLEVLISNQTNPTCYQGNDGNVSITATGGTPPYSYEWENGNTNTSLSNLIAGSYFIKVTDAEGCVAIEEIELIDPNPIVVDLGENRTLCLDQELVLDISIADTGATYLWQSDTGFSSTMPQVTLTNSGTYTATVTSSLGCVGSSTITVAVSDQQIDADFLVLSQAFTGNEVTLVNVSVPKGEKVEWSIPESTTITKIEDSVDRLKVIFDEPGTYEFVMRTYQGECYAEYTKKLVVEKATELPNVGDARKPFIEEFLVYPNPTDGNFTVKVVLAEAASIVLRVFSLTHNQVEYEQRKDGLTAYEIPVHMTVSSGAYVLVLETPEGDEIRKIIIE